VPAGPESHLYIRDNEGDSGGTVERRRHSILEAQTSSFFPKTSEHRTQRRGLGSPTHRQPYIMSICASTTSSGATPSTVQSMYSSRVPTRTWDSHTGRRSRMELTWVSTPRTDRPVRSSPQLTAWESFGPFFVDAGRRRTQVPSRSHAASNETEPPASASAPVLPPAYSSNQIAQRNVQIGSSCTYSITNSSSATRICSSEIS